MSESESIASRASQPGMPRIDADDLMPEIAARAIPEREGLPRSYRMRADAHYVDQLEAPAQPAIRMLKVGQIDGRDLPAEDSVHALTESIALHGLLQPLLVRRHGGRYALIAGRKRLVAAIAAGLAVVPCAVHEAEGAAAEALAAADNLRLQDDPAGGESQRDDVHPVLEAISSDLSTIRTSISLLRTARSGGLSQKVGADLIDSQTARAEWLLQSLLGRFETSPQTMVAAIVKSVTDNFAAQMALTGLELDCSISPAAAVWKLPEASTTAAITGAIFGTLACLDGVSRPRIELHADAPNMRALRIEIVQRSARVPANIGAHEEPARPDDLIPFLAVRLARMVAAPQGGGADLTPLPGVGSVLQITFGLTS